MLQGLMLAASLGAPLPIVDELKADLERHKKRSALGANGGLGDRSAVLRTAAHRPWLGYDPDALLPSPFDVFLLSGACPRIPWRQPSDDTGGASVCYIMGCGRSGTTILGDILSRFRNLLFLNEPRQLWIPLLPAVDVWSASAPERRGRLRFTAAEASGQAPPLEEGDEAEPLAKAVCCAYRDLAELVSAQSSDCVEGVSRAERRVVVVEKFPEHAFRVEFLSAICGQGLGPRRCKFIHMIRDGVDVARSVARFGNAASWYGVKDDTKWRQLLSLLSESPLGLGAAFQRHLESSDVGVRLFARGLVEWALSMEAARSGASAVIEESPCLELRYEDLIASPSSSLSALEDFLGLERSEEVHACAAETLRTRDAKPLSTVEADVLKGLRGSKIEELLLEFGRELPPE